MEEVIELGLESADGIIDCRLELQQDSDESYYYSVTILYPHVVNGFSRSEIFCHDMRRGTDGGFYFDGEDIHPKIKKLEAQLSEEILKQSGK